MARIGDTVRLTFTFRTFAGELADSSTSVIMRVYGTNRSQIGSEIDVSTAGSHPSVGVYEYNYVIPDVAIPAIVIEASGTIEGLAEVEREVVPISWAE